MNVMLPQTDRLAVDVNLREALLPIWVVRPIRVGIAQVAVFDAPMHAVAVGLGDDAHAVCVAHSNRAAASRHVATH